MKLHPRVVMIVRGLIDMNALELHQPLTAEMLESDQWLITATTIEFPLTGFKHVFASPLSDTTLNILREYK